jgi:hypothetical protein
MWLPFRLSLGTGLAESPYRVRLAEDHQRSMGK